MVVSGQVVPVSYNFSKIAIEVIMCNFNTLDYKDVYFSHKKKIFF